MREGLNRFYSGTPGGDDEVREVMCQDILPNPFQPRQAFKDEQLDELAQSIKTYGLLQPIVVRPFNNTYQLVAGERRWRACQKLGWHKIPAVIKDINDSAMAAMALIENLQRENLDYFEEAEGFHRLLDDFGLTQEVLAQRIGKSQSTIANKLRLLKLGPAVRQVLAESQLTERHARSLLRLPDDGVREQLLTKIVRLNLNVKQTEELIEQVLSDNPGQKIPEKKAKFVIKDYRILLNTVRQALVTIEQIGLRPQLSHSEGEDYYEVIIRLPKNN